MRRSVVAGAGLVAVLALAGCAERDEPAPASAATPPAATASSVPRPAAATPSATTTTLPGMPRPRTVEESPVDPSQIRSAADLPGAFECQAGVAPIQIPASTPTPTATGAPAGAPRPAVVVCGSALADREALFLYYAPTPQAKLAALQDAFLRAKYVHGGPNWVAAGTVNPTMGTVGGEVYR